MVPKEAVALPLRYGGAGMVAFGLIELVFLHNFEGTTATALGEAMGTWWVLEWTALGALIGYFGLFDVSGRPPATWVSIPGPKVAYEWIKWLTFGWVAYDVLFALLTPIPGPFFGLASLSYVLFSAALGGMVLGGHYCGWYAFRLKGSGPWRS